jgi:hypothetical protein
VRIRAAGNGRVLAAYCDELRRRRFSLSSIGKAEYELPRFFDYLKRRRVQNLRRVEEAHLVSFFHYLTDE